MSTGNEGILSHNRRDMGHARGLIAVALALIVLAGSPSCGLYDSEYSTGSYDGDRDRTCEELCRDHCDLCFQFESDRFQCRVAQCTPRCRAGRCNRLRYSATCKDMLREVCGGE